MRVADLEREIAHAARLVEIPLAGARAAHVVEAAVRLLTGLPALDVPIASQAPLPRPVPGARRTAPSPQLSSWTVARAWSDARAVGRGGGACFVPSVVPSSVGIPVAVKANLAVAGWPCTAGSRALAGWWPGVDADVVANWRHAGAVPVAAAGMDAFAMGHETASGPSAPVGHPLDPRVVPGGSSGGSAALVARRVVPLALGSDTGGSVRQPAALCGVVGLLPTRGRLSRAGLVPFASSLDGVGILGVDVATVAWGLRHGIGTTARDATWRGVSAPASVGRGVEGVRVGVPRRWREGLTAPVRRGLDRALEALRREGASVVAVDVPGLDAALAAYVVLSSAEAMSEIARYDGRRRGPRGSGATPRDQVRHARGRDLEDEVAVRVVVGAWVTSSDRTADWVGRARRVRAQLAAHLAVALADVHALVGPTVPRTAWRRGTLHDPVARMATDRFTVPASLAGLPALTVPAPVQGWPVGVQVVGRPDDEDTLFRLGLAIAPTPPTG